jgi:diaminopimelate epimerase
VIIDIDECTEGTAGCAQMCTNQDGSYSCSCGSGYRLVANAHGCEGKLFIVTNRQCGD